MIIELSPETWVKIRHDYEHTSKPVDDICSEYGVSSGTLRDRMRRWGWTRRRPRIAAEGPPPTEPIEQAAPLAPAIIPLGVPAAAPPEEAPRAAPGEEAPAEIVPRLQGAIARVLPAIEATVAKLATETMQPREMERAARTLSSLTRTLRELNGLLSQHQPRATHDNMPEDIDAFRIALARRIEALLASWASEESEAQSAVVTEMDCRVNPGIKSGGGNDEA